MQPENTIPNMIPKCPAFLFLPSQPSLIVFLFEAGDAEPSEESLEITV